MPVPTLLLILFGTVWQFPGPPPMGPPPVGPRPPYPMPDPRQPGLPEFRPPGNPGPSPNQPPRLGGRSATPYLAPESGHWENWLLLGAAVLLGLAGILAGIVVVLARRNAAEVAELQLET